MHFSDSAIESLRDEISGAIRGLRPPSSLFPAFYVAEQRRLADARDQLAAIDAEIAECCAKRDAAARRLVTLTGKERSPPAAEQVAAPFAWRAAS